MNQKDKPHLPVSHYNLTSSIEFGEDEMNFDIPPTDCTAAGVCRITIASTTGLPDITDTVTIDATTQPQYGTAPANVCATINSPSYMRVELSTNGDTMIACLSMLRNTGKLIPVLNR